jgi:hypothetical protein
MLAAERVCNEPNDERVPQVCGEVTCRNIHAITELSEFERELRTCVMRV